MKKFILIATALTCGSITQGSEFLGQTMPKGPEGEAQQPSRPQRNFYVPNPEMFRTPAQLWQSREDGLDIFYFENPELEAFMRNIASQSGPQARIELVLPAVPKTTEEQFIDYLKKDLAETKRKLKNTTYELNQERDGLKRRLQNIQCMLTGAIGALTIVGCYCVLTGKIKVENLTGTPKFTFTPAATPPTNL